MNKHFITLTSILVIILAGCVEQSGGNDNGNKEGEGASTFNWTMISVWSNGMEQFERDKRFVELIEKYSDGRLQIKLHQVGEIAEADQVLDTVSDGTVEMGSDWPGYWSGKNPAFDLLGTHSLGFNGIDYMMWIYQGGGLDIYNEIYGQFNTVYFPTVPHMMESGIRSNVPIESLEDLDGLNIRFVGTIPQRILQEIGANPVAISANEIYEGLQRGVIDAAEFSTPWHDEIANLNEVTKYLSVPGWHQTGSINGIEINKDAWEELPEDLQEVVYDVSRMASLDNWLELMYNDAFYSNKHVEEDGLVANQLSEEDINKLTEITKEIVDELAEENKDFENVLESQRNFLEEYADYREWQGPWGYGESYDAYMEE